jgi:KDO2-lipid IV(A) lauroyltransferase
MTSEHKVGARNLAAAFPEKSEEERARLLAEVWDNLARQMIEFAFLDDLVAAFDPKNPEDGPVTVDGLDQIEALRTGDKPAIIFGAHLGNWELNAAIGAKLGLPVTALFRPPNNPYLAAELEKRRATFVDKLVVSGRGAALQVARALARGKTVGIIVDQRIADGQMITFFGRPSMSNPIIGALARMFDYPVAGCYSVRQPDGRFRLVVTPPLDLPRDHEGRVDAEATNVMVHGMVESWIRDNPGQWLWLHDRWRSGRRKYGQQF